MRSFSTLQLALGASIAVHAALLTVRFVDPEGFNRVFKDTPLEVVLVNARSAERPDKAQAIAQFSLAGGGDADKGRATTPLPPSALTDMGDANDEAQRRIEAMQEQQTVMLAQVRKLLAALPPADPREASNDPQAQAREDKRRQLVKLLAEIQRRVNEQNARPRKRYVSPATREAVYALYYDTLRHKIEDRGTMHFPEMDGKKLYGELTMILTINFDGRVLSTEVVQSSGSRQLDLMAQAIARSAGPFGDFNSAMRRQADQIVVVSRFRFTRDQTLETKQLSSQ
ncbi:MAG TPA: TonB C-terminal domain-containing protein [Rhodoferax sp.]|nr:TonB C-terminal domain-containing protein [Rhodoferax sp.]